MKKTGVIVEIKNGQAKVRVPVEGGCGGCRGCSRSCRCAYLQVPCGEEYAPGQRVVLQTQTVPSLICAMFWLALPLLAAVCSIGHLPPWGSALIWLAGMLGLGWVIAVPLKKYLKTEIVGICGEDEADE